MRTRRQVGGIAATLAAVLTACTTQSAGGPAPSSQPPSTPASAPGDVEVVADELDAPWSIAFHGQTPLISERDTARILELDRAGNTRDVGIIAGPLSEC